ncbi:sigma-54-dependent Fis family transcriptional regulator [uncultured Oscillibacter sp.]|uniref:sigma-54 interaction domain-containing protein n=1 Tax=uncultured Oscillibacter sp. TaxID=876091 RepID=UPI0025EC88E1|nr:sigma 54-interacting transcriptional regulator [uncultured Oscillibacter sp.]
MEFPNLAADPAAQREYELLKVLAEHYFGSMLVTDSKGRFLYVNDGCCKLLGIDRETLLGLSIYDTLHDYCHATSASSIKTLETKKECLSNHTLKDSGKQVLALSRPHFGPDGELEYVPTYSWDERELYTLLEKFDQERDNVRSVIRFMQATDKTPDMLIAESQPMRSLLEYADHIAAVDSTVIIYGESGSGKELFAKYIHAKSSRADQVFIPINCASLPPSLLEAEMFGYEKGTFTGGMKDGKIGLFEFADKGTVFLDEIGEMPLELQAKLLRIIENGEIKRLGSNQIIKSDVRIIAATNRNLAEMVREKTFRADLYYRLNVLVINVPPLRERAEDVRPLAEYFVQAFNKKYGFTKRLSPETIQVMEQYDWPGNVRELRNTVERMMVESKNTLVDLKSFRKMDTVVVERPAPPAVDSSLPYQQAMDQCQRQYITAVVDACGGDLRQAAQRMGLHLSTLYRKMEKLGLPLHKEAPEEP